MALTAQTVLASGPLGKNRFEIGTTTMSAGEAAIPTKLRWIEKVEIMQNGAADQSAAVYRNAVITTEGGTPGSFWVTGTTAGDMRYLVIGR